LFLFIKTAGLNVFQESQYSREIDQGINKSYINENARPAVHETNQKQDHYGLSPKEIDGQNPVKNIWSLY
jgi:hypothetical protein